MRIISKIEIKHFRSFLGTPKPYATELANLTDVNIFSGANDSGKSNVLRALNLFFNDKVANNETLNFERDFFIGKKDRVQKVIEIGITFDLTGIKKDSFLPDVFKITKFYDRYGFRNYTYSFYLKEKDKEITIDSRTEQNTHISEIFMPDNPTAEERKRAEKREWIYRVKFLGFLNQAVTLEYVPAIRDRDFFAQLFGRVITQIKENEDNRLANLLREKNKITNWEKTIKNTSEKREFKEHLLDESWREQRLTEIADEERKESKLTSSIEALEEEVNKYSAELISSINFLPAEFKVGKDLREFFENFDVGTGSRKDISLNERGDGIQAKFVPKILDFLSQIGSQNRYYLWAIEEPENSAEYKNQQELAREIKEGFSTTKQIFITTHAEEYLQLYDGSDVEPAKRQANLYHVRKMGSPEGEYSQIFFFDVDKNEFEFADQKSLLEDDLGQSYLRAKYSKELKQREGEFLAAKQQIDNENLKLKETIRAESKPIVFVEDNYTQLYKVVWLKLNGLTYNNQNCESLFDNNAPFAVYPAGGAPGLNGFLRSSNIEYWQNKKVIGLFDFDEAGVAAYKNIKQNKIWDSQNAGTKQTGIYRKRSDHGCFYAMLLPVPKRLDNLADLEYPSFIEIENLFPNDFLTSNHLATEKITTGSTKYLKIHDQKKSKIWEHVLNLTEADLHDFIPLFDSIYSIFSIVKESQKAIKAPTQ